MRWFIKGGKPAAPGEERTWKDGKVRVKVGQRWVVVRNKEEVPSRLEAIDRKAMTAFQGAVKGTMWAGDDLADMLSSKYKITDFDSFKKFVSNTPVNRINQMFHDAVEYMKDSIAIPGNKQLAIDRFRRAFNLMKQYRAKPRVRLTVDVPTKTGSTHRQRPLPSASFKPTKIKEAQSRLAGWTNMKTLPTPDQMKAMVKKGTAKLLSGSISPDKPFTVGQRMENVIVPFREGSQGVSFRLRQSYKKRKRTVSTAVIELTVPYPYAQQFLMNQIKSARTRNSLVKEMHRSKPFKEASS